MFYATCPTFNNKNEALENIFLHKIETKLRQNWDKAITNTSLNYYKHVVTTKQEISNNSVWHVKGYNEKKYILDNMNMRYR